MSSNWPHVAKMIIIMTAVLISAQTSFGETTNSTHQMNDSLSNNNISVPVGFETDLKEAQRIHALLQKDPAAIEDFIGICERILSRLQPGEYPIFRADIENSLGDAYYFRNLGNKSDNLERAIELYGNSSLVFTRDANSEKWAMIEYGLGNSYRDRIRGNKSENIERAIRHFNNSLQIFTRDKTSAMWARIEDELGFAYYIRKQGDRAENIEIAIQHFNNSSQASTREADSVNWALAEIDLGNAYSDRIQGDLAENFEMAIQHYNNSQQVFTRDRDPANWASVENDLGISYRNRIRGDKAENIEIAIQHYNNSLEVRTREARPFDWAMTEDNLAVAYDSRIRGDLAENIEMAIQHYNNALQVFTRENDSGRWSQVENNLGTSYINRIRGDKSQNMEMAIQHLNNSLQVRTREADPINWAETEFNLGTAYINRILGNESQNIEMAIRHLNDSLQIRTREADPLRWASAENNLGVAYAARIQGNHAENIEMAIRHFHNALQARETSSLLRDFRQTERNLGNLYFREDRWQEALDPYMKAIAAGDLLYRSGLSAESKSGEVKENSAFYRNAAFAAVQINKPDEALLILEQGKTRLMTETLRLQAKRPDRVPDEVWAKYERSAQTYRALQNTPLPEENSVQAQLERERRSEEALKALSSATEGVKKYVPGFQKDLKISDIQEILDNETALLSFCVTDKGSIVFVVTRSGGVEPVDMTGFNSTDLDQLVVERDNQGNITGGWIGNMAGSTREVMQATIDQVLAELSQKLLEPAVAEIPDDIKNLILLPSGSLFLLPIHAAPLSGSHELLCDRYVVSYAPSIELLIEMKTKAKERTGEGLYAVVNPTGNLKFAACEGENISWLFQDRRIDEGSKGTLASVLNGARGQAYLHFACHGGYNWNDPTQSALILYNESLLTLADLQENDNLLLSSRLVTLSACETGITDVFVGSPDEYVGLPAGFMLSGAPCVVSSLWSVDDAFTSLLMERFYSNHITKGMDIPSALQEAQQWVRGLTYLEAAKYEIECGSTTKTGQRNDNLRSSGQVRNETALATELKNAKPFTHPYYWAGFTMNGA